MKFSDAFNLTRVLQDNRTCTDSPNTEPVGLNNMVGHHLSKDHWFFKRIQNEANRWTKYATCLDEGYKFIL